MSGWSCIAPRIALQGKFISSNDIKLNEFVRLLPGATTPLTTPYYRVGIC